MVSLWMDIISAMDRSAKDRFSWNSADIIVVSSWKIPATFWAVKILFIQENSRITREKLSLKLCGAPIPLFPPEIGGDGSHFVEECRQMLCLFGRQNLVMAGCAVEAPSLLNKACLLWPPPRLSWRREGGVTARLAAVCTGGDKRERPSPPVFLHMSCA